MPASSVAPDQVQVSASGRRGHADPLLDAVLRRDAQSASRHLAAWVHRRGVSSLDSWMVSDLPSLAGDEGYYWLAGLLESPLIAAAVGEAPTLPAPISGAERASRELDRALAELADTFPESVAPPEPARALAEPAPASKPKLRVVHEAQPELVAEPAPVAETQPKPATAPLAEQEPAPDSLAAPDPLAVPELLPAFNPVAVPQPVAVPESLAMPEPVVEAGPLSQSELAAELDGVLARSSAGPDLRVAPTSLEGEPQPTFAGNSLSARQAGSDPFSARQAGSDALPAAPLVSGPGPVALESSEPEPPELEQSLDEALLPEAEAVAQPAPLALGRWAKRSLGRARNLLRDCYEEAIGTLHAEPVDSAENVEIGPVSEPESPLPAVVPAAPTSFAVGAPLTSSVGAPPPPPAHWDRAAVAAPGPTGQPAVIEPPAATARLLAPGLFTGRRASNRPAPAPAALADLRAWLPDAGDAPRRAS